MKYFQRVQWVGFIIILMLGVIGCEMFGGSSLTTPVGSTGVAPGREMLANFWVGRGQNKYEVSSEDQELQIGTPEGSYLLEYSIKVPSADGTFDIQTFAIVFKAGEEGALLAIGLKPGDDIWEVQLIPGDISAGVTPVMEQNGVAVFLWPDDESSFSVEDVFEEPAPEDFVLIILIAEGVIAPLYINNDDSDSDIQIDIIEEDESSDGGGKFSITTKVSGGGSISPSSVDGVPYGSSRSFKIRANSRKFEDILDVTVNGTSVIGQVQKLGNGDGHLVIHDITEDLVIEATFQ